MNAADLQRFADGAPLTEGFRFELLRREEIGKVVELVTTWIPEISVGGASCYRQEDFYASEVFFSGETEPRVHIVLALKQGDELGGMFACELDHDTLGIYAALGVAAPHFRGSNVAAAGMAFTEVVGRHLDMGFAFGMATLRNPHVQLAFERAGWQLIGIMPGYDRELVAPNTVKRVFEALYGCVLVNGSALQRPERCNLTPRTQSFFDLLWGSATTEC